MWQLNENHVVFNLEWKIPTYSFPYKCGTRRCNLFLTEKYLIIKEDPLILLNKHTELISKYCQINKFTPTIVNKCSFMLTSSVRECVYY